MTDDHCPDPAPYLDAIALVKAGDLHDTRSAQRILDTAEDPDLAVILSQMVRTAIRTQGMTLDQFLEMLADKAVSV